MKIEAHLLHWQEKDIMPYVIKHYRSFCNEIIIHDNHSKDGSAEMAKELGCTVIPFGSDFFDDGINKDVKNECWKGSKANWCIVADFDELLWCNPNHISIESTLHGTQSHIFKPQGWQIMSEDWPVNELTEILNGYPFDNYSKCVLFDPWLKEVNFNEGAHRCNPISPDPGIEVEMFEFKQSMYVLHYKHIGGVQRTIDRYKVLQRRLSKQNRKMGWGCHYNRSPASIRQEWTERMAKSRPLI